MSAFIGVITGSLLSLLGVVLTLRWNKAQHASELAEERRRIQDERHFNAKRDALIKAADCATRFVHYYATLADRRPPADDNVPIEVVELSTALNQLHFYCSLETIQTANKLSFNLTDAFQAAIKARMPSLITETQAANVQSQINNNKENISRLQNEINILLSHTPSDPLIASHREVTASLFQDNAARYGELAELAAKRGEEVEHCRDVIISYLPTISNLLKEILVLSRSELKFPIDENKHREIMEEQLQKSATLTTTFVDDLRQTMRPDNKD